MEEISATLCRGIFSDLRRHISFCGQTMFRHIRISFLSNLLSWFCQRCYR